MTAKRLFAPLLALPLMLAGCVGYQFGTTLPNDYKTICVKTFVNKTGEPNLEFAATQNTLQQFQRDGSLSVTDAERADLVLETILTDASFDAVRFAKKRTATAQEYRMIVTAQITLTDRKTGTVMIEKRKVAGEATFETTGDMQQARLTAQPKVSRDLGHTIVKNVVEYW